VVDDQDPTGMGQLATDSVAPIGEELRHRLLADLDERDSLAIETALLKAFIGGMRMGNLATVEQVVDESTGETTMSRFGVRQAGPSELEEHFPDLDPWAARYG